MKLGWQTGVGQDIFHEDNCFGTRIQGWTSVPEDNWNFKPENLELKLRTGITSMRLFFHCLSLPVPVSSHIWFIFYWTFVSSVRNSVHSLLTFSKDSVHSFFCQGLPVFCWLSLSASSFINRILEFYLV